MSKLELRRRSAWAGFAAAALVAVAGLSVFAQTAGNSNEGADFAPKAAIQPRSAADEAKSFVMPAGYRMELVVSDPDVDTPSVIEFDGDGRMYVAEFVSYMPNVEGAGQIEPVSRITRFEDTNGDGTYDKRVVFADKLVLPRMILPLDKDTILTNETHNDNVLKLTDTDGDGVADKREVFYSGVGLNRDGNLEHEQSGFVWGLDNWIYSTYNSFRFRWTPGGILREPTGPNGGQWGLTQDDDGKMWFVCAGCERGPVNFQVPIQYGAFRITPRPESAAGPGNTFDEYEPGFDIVWPLVGLSDTQGGMGRVRMPIGVLNHATATAGPDIVRGDRVPQDLIGDLLYAEPVGRLIRRAKIVKTEGLTQLKNAYPGSEFILSSDPLFRPVNIRTAPDGTVYIADMYRGIIQEAQWTGPGSYLRHKIQQYQLDKVVNHGRIWRLRFDGVPEVPATPNGPAARALPAVPAIPAIELDHTKPQMFSETPAQLVSHLTHPNGWWRDMAQRQLVLRQDKSVVPALQTMARSSDNLLARFHALWTLEGLNALDAALVRDMMKDPNARMRVQAIRASETLYKAGNKSFADDYRAATKDSDPDVAIQGMLTLNLLKVPNAADVIKEMVDGSKVLGIREIGRVVLSPPPSFGGGRGGPVLTSEQQQLMQRGQTIYTEVCFSCHGEDGRGAPVVGGPAGTTMAPPLAGSAHVQGHRDFVIKTLLHGLTGPNNGKTYTEVMIPMLSGLKDDGIAAVGSFIRNSFGNSASFIAPADVARVRMANTTRKVSWTVDDIEKSLPVLLQAQADWKVSASHNSEGAPGALTLVGWNSGAPAAAGMWYQVELPQPAMVTEVQFNAPAPRGGGPGGRGNPGGRGGRGGRGDAAPGAGAPAAGAPAAAAPAPAPAARGAQAGRAGAAAAAAANDMQVQVSMDGKAWTTPPATAQTGTLNTLAFSPVRAKFVRITRTAAADSGPNWTILNLRLFQAPPTARP